MKSDPDKQRAWRERAARKYANKKRKRKTLPKQSKKRKAMQPADDERHEWGERHPYCMRCGGVGTDIHEIAKRTSPDWRHPASYLKLCRPCHTLLEDYGKYPIIDQMILKARVTPNEFNPDVLNRLRGRAETAITYADLFWRFLEKTGQPKRDYIGELVDE